MQQAVPIFQDRADAGVKLAEAVSEAGLSDLADPILIALPRGGVPVAFAMAHRLGLPMDVLIVRKMRAPGDPEIGIGAVVDGRIPRVVITEEAVRGLSLPPGYLDTERHHQIAEVERRHRMYFGEDAPDAHDHQGRDAIIVDDGIANGGSIRAAIEAVRAMGVASVRIAVPVAPARLVTTLGDEVDDVVCLSPVDNFSAVGAFYADFSETPDQEVMQLLKEARRLQRMLQ
ncbi:MAG: phosphoribosyltransferase family protein [Neorhizobium sp.]|jgi:putative phosphoribosyl transferase|nr:phosphoribosyltransferase family protein [Neorhizobium sp.]